MHASGGAGAPAAAEAANLDELAPLRSVKGVRDLLRGQLRVLGQAEVLPVDNLCGPRRLPLSIQVETERALGIVDATVGDRRRADGSSVGTADDHHRRTVRLDCIPVAYLRAWQ
jgi:hypothetical protein